ncbi:MAG: hypothetical protein GQ569_03785 [Methylococcaceae bacterium]|nr:hypothetical protein [Methylococcaceae bacterium]
MKKIDVALVRWLQFIVFVIFTFAVLVYFSAMVLLPLELVALLIKLFGVFGVSSLISALIAIPIVGYLTFSAYKIPALGKMIVDTGVDLVNIGKARIEAFNEIADSVKG